MGSLLRGSLRLGGEGDMSMDDIDELDMREAQLRIKLYDEYREARFTPPPLLRRLVLAGYLGRKSGKGFYDYSTTPPTPNDFLVSSVA